MGLTRTPIMAAVLVPARIKVVKPTISAAQLVLSDCPLRSGIAEERLEQIVVGKTGKQAIVELPPVALGSWPAADATVGGVAAVSLSAQGSG